MGRLEHASGESAELEPHAVVLDVEHMHRCALALSGSPHDAEDLVQETLARVLARPRLVRGGDTTAYLLGAVRKTFLAQRRAESRRPRSLPLGDGVARTPDSLPEGELDRIELIEALVGLPADLRRVLVAVDVAGLSYREAARALEIPTGTVMSRLHRARGRVARRLTAEDIGPRAAA